MGYNKWLYHINKIHLLNANNNNTTKLILKSQKVKISYMEQTHKLLNVFITQTPHTGTLRFDQNNYRCTYTRFNRFKCVPFY